MGGHPAPAFPEWEELLAPLTEKQELFVRWYVVLLNATAAAEKAGYRGSRATLASIGYENLQKPHIAAAIEAYKKHRNADLDRIADDVVERMRHIAFADLRDVASWGPDGLKLLPSEELGDDAATSIREVRVSRGRTTTHHIKQYDSMEALRWLGDYCGLTQRPDDGATPLEKARQIKAALEEIDESTGGADS